MSALLTGIRRHYRFPQEVDETAHAGLLQVNTSFPSVRVNISSRHDAVDSKEYEETCVLSVQFKKYFTPLPPFDPAVQVESSLAHGLLM